MITIPSAKKQFSQPNNSDLFGNIFYTKNINLAESGYIKLANRSALLKSNQGDANFGIVPSFGRVNSGGFLIPTQGNPYVTAMSQLGMYVTPDSNPNAPSGLGFTTWGRWWNGRWYVAGPSSIFSRDTSSSPWISITVPANAVDQGNWDASTNSPSLASGIGTPGWFYTVSVAGQTNLDGNYPWNVGDIAYFSGQLGMWIRIYPTNNLTPGNIHAMEVFRSRDTLCVSDGNQVYQFDTSFAQSPTTNLQLQSDFQVCGMAFNGTNMGIITQLSPSVQGKNVESQFYIWDGTASSVNNGYPIASDRAIAIAAYKASWVILTRKGQLLEYSGGGFKLLATFPFYFKDQVWGDFLNQLSYGDAIQINGDYIYINIASNLNNFGLIPQSYNPQFPSGIWCYDPAVGLYHKYSPSISPVSVSQVLQSSVNLSTSEMTIISGTVPPTGSPVRYTDAQGSPIGGLSINTTYYCINISSTVFQLATSLVNAQNGVFIPLTSQGGSTSSFCFISMLDYGGARSSRCAGLGLQGVVSPVFHEVIYSGYYLPSQSAIEIPSLCIDVPFFKSIGYFVTAKITSAQVKDSYEKVFIKFDNLVDDDLITVKTKLADIPGLPITTSGNGATWTSPTVLTTTQDISDAFDYLQAPSTSLECEIIAGTGAGQMAQVSSITLAGGVYTVTLASPFEGAISGLQCDIKLENWKQIGTVTTADADGYKELPIGSPSKQITVKVIFFGAPNQGRIEGVQLINSTNQAAV